MVFENPEVVLSFISNAIPGFEPTGKLEELAGGNLNHVWRVFGDGQSFVVKHAPPYIAKAPDIPISPQRILIEAAALRLFEKPPLNGIVSDRLRPPRLIYADEKKHAIILEDLGNLPSLDISGALGQNLGAELGAFIGKLHRFTYQNKAVAEAINNRPIQETRLDVQYSRIGPLLKDFGISNWAKLGHRAQKLGEKYLAKGKCLIMGDLWPRSVLIGPKAGQARVIDWEFAHYGRPAQDVAHFLAHLWMLQHQVVSEGRKREFGRLQDAFLSSYLAATGPERALLFDEEETEGAAIHFGAEILARTIGSFQAGYLYEGLGHDHPKIKEALEVAVRYLGAGVKGLTSFPRGSS